MEHSGCACIGGYEGGCSTCKSCGAIFCAHLREFHKCNPYGRADWPREAIQLLLTLPISCKHTGRGDDWLMDYSALRDWLKKRDAILAEKGIVK